MNSPPFHQPEPEYRQEQLASTPDPMQIPAQTNAMSRRDKVSAFCGMALTLCGLQHPTEDEEAGEFCNDMQDRADSSHIDDGNGDLYVSLDMTTLHASAGVKAALLPDSNLSQAAVLPRP